MLLYADGHLDLTLIKQKYCNFLKVVLNFHIDNKTIALTNKYIYLGIILTPFSLFSEMVNVTTDKAKQAVEVIISIMANVKVNTWYPRNKLFESLVIKQKRMFS